MTDASPDKKGVKFNEDANLSVLNSELPLNFGFRHTEPSSVRNSMENLSPETTERQTMKVE